MNDEHPDDELARRLARHFDRARHLRADVSWTSRPTRPGRSSRPLIGAAVILAIAALVGSQLGDGAPGPGEPGELAISEAPHEPLDSGSSPLAIGPGCLPPAMPVADPNFSSVANRLGPTTLPHPPRITEMGQVFDSVDELQRGEYRVPTTSPPGYGLQLIVYGDGPAARIDEPPPQVLRLLYDDQPVIGTWQDFLETGGVVVTQSPDDIWDATTVARSLDDAGHLYSLLDLGPHQAVAHLADPVVRDELRAWHLYWHDGTHDWSIVGIADPIELIEMGQSLYCP